MLRLPDVTICAADSAFVELTARAIDVSAGKVEFADAILFSDRPVAGRFRHVAIPPLDRIEAYSRFCLKELPAHIETPFVLIVQWDGFVADPAAWAQAFRKYDYIGAVWHRGFPPGREVGNGGFSLRSRKLMRALAAMPFKIYHPEDRVICHYYREELERQFAIRIAPAKIAARFAYDDRVPDAPTFGFHGVHNIWRHISDDELAGMAAVIDIARTKPHNLFRLILEAEAGGHLASAGTFYRRVRTRHPAARARTILRDLLGAAEGEARLAALERLL